MSLFNEVIFLAPNHSLSTPYKLLQKLQVEILERDFSPEYLVRDSISMAIAGALLLSK